MQCDAPHGIGLGAGAVQEQGGVIDDAPHRGADVASGRGAGWPSTWDGG